MTRPTIPPKSIGTSYLGRQELDITAERIVFWTIALVPVWWIVGIQIAVYPFVGWYLFYRSFRQPKQVTFPFGWNMWWLYIGVWLLSLVINLALGTAEIGRSMTTLGSIFGVWVLTVIVWYAMRRLAIRYHVIIRAICIVGCCQLLAVFIGQGYVLATGSVLQTHSIITTLVPSIPARVFFDAELYGYDELGWDVESIPRLKSFYYWYPLAGTMSIFICMASLSEPKRFWQVLSFLGGLTTIWFAAARSAQVGISLATFLAIWFGSRLGRKIILGSLIPFGLVSPVVVVEVYKYFFEYRSDSGAARLALYDETFKAFLRSPLLGYGTHGRSETLEVPLGSHSQIYSTLYHTGVLGSFILIVAWIALAVALLRLIHKQPKLSPTLGAWAGLTFVMTSGELEAASVTVFVLAAWLGCAWNWEEQMSIKAKQPWLSGVQIPQPPTPWQSLQYWWSGSI
ncbi:hypothetical protein NIES4073_40470 [Kalymmatonema gypsitolerans NIES-4073]|nr:hypothetical protein NIES4073_40470 [Scytonema sp. NIES-4073]